MTALVTGVLVAAIWCYLAVGRGGFWRGRENDRAMPRDVGDARSWPRVVAVIPARDEAELVGATVASLLGQRYDGAFSVVVVDDHSDDGTADAARRGAASVDALDRLVVLAAPPLPGDWTGKLWAVASGVAHCEALDPPPDYLLLSDADIVHGPGTLGALVSYAVAGRLVLSSLMVALRCESVAERALIPAFVFFFQMLYPFAWVADPARRMAAAAGGCMLVERRALRDAGGMAAIRGSLIDDCALARALKPRGPIRLALAEHVASARPYDTFGEIRRMIVRSAYAQLQFSPSLLLGVAAAMLLVFVAPVGLALSAHGAAQVLGIAAWIAMALLFMPTLARYRVARGWGFGLPAIAVVYLAFTIESAVRHLRGSGGMWKGRANGGTRAAKGPIDDAGSAVR